MASANFMTSAIHKPTNVQQNSPRICFKIIIGHHLNNMSTQTKVALIQLAEAVKELAYAQMNTIGIDTATSVITKAELAKKALNTESPASHPGSPLTNM